jgi:hypothetical protein
MAFQLDEYANKYKHAKLERRDGILRVTLHSNGKELEWGGSPHEDLSYLFADIARDFENKVVTGWLVVGRSPTQSPEFGLRRSNGRRSATSRTR